MQAQCYLGSRCFPEPKGTMGGFSPPSGAAMNAPSARPLFIAQDKLMQWESEGKVRLDASVLTLVAEQRSYRLTEAVRFLRALGPEPVGQSLVGRVRTKDQLKALGAEHYMDSVLMGELAYEVQQGFVGVVVVKPGTPLAQAAVSVSAAPPAVSPPGAAPAIPAAVSPVHVGPAPTPGHLPAVEAAAASGAAPVADSLAHAVGEKQEPTDAELLADFLLANLTG